MSNTLTREKCSSMFKFDNKYEETEISLQNQLSTVYNYFAGHNDIDSMQKVKQLTDKLAAGEFTIVFCGHFSAGKSRIINTLLGKKILPSNPIPTSANLVKIKKGEVDCAKVFFKQESPRLYLAPYDIQLIQSYCRNGDNIDMIEINQNDLFIAKDVTILDTPGIDSVDDAHRTATQSAVYIADLIFYVMDYNHVQSELNFTFIRNLQKTNKAVCLIINQIDKHTETELTFDEFRRSVKKTLAEWGIKVQRIFYTSMKDMSGIHNQYAQLKNFLITNLQEERSKILIDTIKCSLERLVNVSWEVERMKAEERLEIPIKLLNELTEEQQASLTTDYAKLLQEKDTIDNAAAILKTTLDKGTEKILANAYLMPFEVRELAEAYLRTCEPGFKTGFFSTARRVKNEQSLRLIDFYEIVKKKTKSELDWHICNYLLGWIKTNRINDVVLYDTVEKFTVEFSRELLVDEVKTGARVSDEYVTRYADNVASAIKYTTEKQLRIIKKRLLLAAMEQNNVKRCLLDNKVKKFQEYVNALEDIRRQRRNLSEEFKKTAELLNSTTITMRVQELFGSDRQSFTVIKPKVFTVQPEKKTSASMNKIALSAHNNEETYKEINMTDKIVSMAGKLTAAAEIIRSLPGFFQMADSLCDRAARLKSRTFTVVLFGAFSAGKSSFANALIGKNVLSVSPNPMTAAISRIRPVDVLHGHKYALVKIKTEKMMLSDVNYALKTIGVTASNLSEAQKKIKKIKQDSAVSDTVDKMNYSFLAAFVDGYENFRDKFGNSLSVEFDEFNEYAVIESKSCFVESIDIYYDCPLTRNGIVFVDTPGIDSVNARHTGTTFNYIKKADALLFVTYYNHAFSRADREFLIQLGRIKDAFPVDKMFFIINAIDLAENSEEKNMVINYVKKQLIQYGIRQPLLSAVSSLEALREKKTGIAKKTTGMQEFENQFYSFINNDLIKLSIAAATNELQRIMKMIDRLISDAAADKVSKEKQQVNVEREQIAVDALLTRQSAKNMQNRLMQEVDELIYYVQQRVFLRFNDFFRESFNPGVLRSDSHNLKKALNDALHELVEGLGFDFAQEMRATTIRLDRFVENLLKNFQLELTESLQAINPGISFAVIDIVNDAQLKFRQAFININYEMLMPVLRKFKNPKAFFEQGNNQQMNAELQKILNQYAGEYLLQEKNRIKLFYNKLLENQCDYLVEQFRVQLADFYVSLTAVLQDDDLAVKLFTGKKVLTKLVS